MFVELFDQFAASDDDAALRTAEEFVAAEEHQIGPRLDALRGHRLVAESELSKIDQGPGTGVVDHRKLVAVSEFDQFLQVHRFGKPDHHVVAGMNHHQRGSRFTDCPGVVVGLEEDLGEADGGLGVVGVLVEDGLIVGDGVVVSAPVEVTGSQLESDRRRRGADGEGALARVLGEEETAGRLTPASARQALDALVPRT